MECRECHGEIHPERLAVQPRVRTCSHLCAIGWKREQNRLAAQRQRARRRASSAGTKGPMVPRPGFAEGGPGAVPLAIPKG